MARIQVAGVRDYAGNGKESGKPFKMRNIQVIATNDDGTVELGELTFFERSGAPLPQVAPGQTYEAVFAFRSSKGKVTSEIVGLKPVAAVRAAA